MLNRTRQLAAAFNLHDASVDHLDAELAQVESYLEMDNIFAELDPYIQKGKEDEFEDGDFQFLMSMKVYNQKASGNKIRFQTDNQKVRLIRIWCKYVYEGHLGK